MKPTGKRKRNHDISVGRGWVGRFIDGDIGWNTPNHCTGFATITDSSMDRSGLGPDDTLYLCRITVEVLKDKRGRYITRRARTVGAAK